MIAAKETEKRNLERNLILDEQSDNDGKIKQLCTEYVYEMEQYATRFREDKIYVEKIQKEFTLLRLNIIVALVRKCRKSGVIHSEAKGFRYFHRIFCKKIVYLLLRKKFVKIAHIHILKTVIFFL